MRDIIKYRLPSKILYAEYNQKQYESEIFIDFALRLKLKDFKMFQPEPPKPDMIIEIYKPHKYTIGCEIKDLYWDNTPKKGSKEKRKIESWKRFAKCLRNELDKKANGFEFLYGVLSLKKFKIIENQETRKNLTKELIDFIKDEYFPIYKRWDKFPTKKFLQDYVEDLRIKTYPERNILWWETSLMSGKKKFDMSIFEKEIQQKNSKCHDFTGCKEKWLLLYAKNDNLGNSISFPFDLIEERPVISNKHKFDKIFFFDCFQESIFRVFPDFIKVCWVDKNGQGYLKNNINLLG